MLTYEARGLWRDFGGMPSRTAMKRDPIPANWPFPTFKGRPVPKRRTPRVPAQAPDAPF